MTTPPEPVRAPLRPPAAARSGGAALLTAVVLGAVTALGCGIGSAKSVAPTADLLGEFANRLSHGRELTYTATYRMADGQRVTLVRRGNGVAVLAAQGRFVVTDDRLLRCGGPAAAGGICYRAPKQQPELDGPTSALVTGVTGPGFLIPEDALAVVAAAALVPGAKVNATNQTIAGEDAVCGEVTGLAAANTPGQQPLRDFSVCVTDRGGLAFFRGTLGDGRTATVELTGWNSVADSGAFSVPTGARVVDVAALPAD